jgi:hypothetical protein
MSHTLLLLLLLLLLHCCGGWLLHPQPRSCHAVWSLTHLQVAEERCLAGKCGNPLCSNGAAAQQQQQAARSKYRWAVVV